MNQEEHFAQFMKYAIEAAVLGGKKIMEIYSQDFEVFEKEDSSPLTVADQQANDLIEKILQKTDIPILSEEGKQTPYEQRKDWNQLWVVDPLDGTKEFVKRNGEFTVNIALVENGVPVLGVIYVPVKKILYYGHKLIGSWRLDLPGDEVDFNWGDSQKNSIKLPRELAEDPYIVVASRSHMSDETKEYIQKLEKEHNQVETTSMGSSLKICLVAEGKAHEYPRFAPTMEWDTAAGHAIAKFAGKQFVDYQTGKEMVYNRKELRNNWFLVK